MGIKKTDIILYTYALKQKLPKGFSVEMMDWDLIEKSEEQFDVEDLIECDLLEHKSGNELVFSDWGQRLADILVEPDAWIRIEHNNADIVRLLYVMQDDYICLDLRPNNRITLMHIPSIPIFIGAYAKMIEKNRGLLKEDSLIESMQDGIICASVQGEAQEKTLKMHIMANGYVEVLRNEVHEQLLFCEEQIVNLITEWMFSSLKEQYGY